ncbi:putative AMP-dependent synthetase and ligase [Rhodospirillaceae bacterium LM-1]|nr:putative AMP-dependent synthetase and ligase [Rhodospirillaceae bacterium LM-1]
MAVWLSDAMATRSQEAFWEFERSSNIALIDSLRDVRLSYADLDDKISQLIDLLAKDRGKRLAFIVSGNDVGTIVAYLALLRLGHAVLLVSTKLESQALSTLINAYTPELIVLPAGQKLGALPSEYRAREAGDGIILFQRTDAPQSIHPELALLLPTSGSTGSPKVVRLSRRALNANAHQIVGALGMGEEDRAVTSLSPSYSFGLSVINSHLACGGSLLLSERAVMERGFWNELNTHEITTIPGVPFTFDVLKRVGGEQLAPDSLRKLIQAGGRMDPAVIRHTYETFAKKGADLFIMYGQTEAAARITVLAPSELAVSIGSVGRAVPGGEIRIDAVGQVEYEGPNVMMGYAENRADLSREDELSGVLPTGDIGYVDEAGRLWITGRLKRIIKPYGLRINLDDIEASLAVMGSLAVTGDDSRIIVHIEKGDEKRIAGAAREIVKKMQLPASTIRVYRMNSLPRSAEGKILYSELQK